MDGAVDAAPEQREDRGPRIPSAKIQSINATPTISIFYKPNKEAVMILLDGKFPRDAAMVFCNRMRNDLMDSDGSKSFTIVGGDLNAHKEVLAWIKDSIEAQDTVKFKELDESVPGFFTSYANVLLSGYYLGIPARDLSDPILKRMTAIARKKLMSWDEVEYFYQTTFAPSLPQEKIDPLREVAATSVFYAWWNARIDSEETPEDMCILDVLRKEYRRLDQDLHDLCDRNEAEVRRKWEEKRKAKEQGGTDGAGWNQAEETTEGATGGWNDNAAATEGGGWGAAIPAATGGWDDTAAPSFSNNGGNTWDSADAVTEDQPYAPPNSLASPEFNGAKNALAPLPPLHEISNTNGFSNQNGFAKNGDYSSDWADQVNEEVVDQGHQYNVVNHEW